MCAIQCPEKVKKAALYEKIKDLKKHKAGLPWYVGCAVFDVIANISIT